MKNAKNLIQSKEQRASFVLETQSVKKIMVLDLGFLGDIIHSLPALWVIHQNYPTAELHIAVSIQVVSLFNVVPWIKKAWGYMRYPRHASLMENIRFIQETRREQFDLLINLNGSDRSCFLSYLIGAKYSVGKISEKTRPFRNYLFYKTIYYSLNDHPLYIQRCEMLKKIGLKSKKAAFHIEVKKNDFKKIQTRIKQITKYNGTTNNWTNGLATV
jgi:ADP-heptose:LPS heptosyltransferase